MTISASRRITVSAKHFLAAWLFISKEETRYYLNGVLIEPHPDGGVIMAATDGHALIAIRDRKARFEGDQSFICTIPKSFAAIMKGKGFRQIHFIGDTAYVTNEEWADQNLDAEQDPAQITENHLAVAWAPPIDGIFPDWRKVANWPKDSGKLLRTSNLNGRLITRFADATALIIGDKTSPALKIYTPDEHPGQKDKPWVMSANPTVIRAPLCPDLFGLIMPMHFAQGELIDEQQFPAWLGLPEPAKPAAANDAASPDAKTGAA
ncbi:MAG: hypothetical protein ABID63_18455 [Pseudomonadota bacterium]